MQPHIFATISARLLPEGELKPDSFPGQVWHAFLTSCSVQLANPVVELG